MATFPIPHDARYRLWSTPDSVDETVSILINGNTVATSPRGNVFDHTLDLTEGAVVSTEPYERHLMVFELPDAINGLSIDTTVFDSG
jgi:hypothetical protein